jgi:hypothetical protein
LKFLKFINFENKFNLFYFEYKKWNEILKFWNFLSALHVSSIEIEFICLRANQKIGRFEDKNHIKNKFFEFLTLTKWTIWEPKAIYLLLYTCDFVIAKKSRKTH